VSLGFDGGLRVERGFIRKVDETPIASVRGEAEAEAGVESRETSTTLPEKLVAQLTAHRTAALREAVADRPDVALIAGACAGGIDILRRQPDILSRHHGTHYPPVGFRARHR
jgi:hypothetical protein